MGVFMHRPFGRAAALTLAAAMLLGAPSALAAQVPAAFLEQENSISAPGVALVRSGKCGEAVNWGLGADNGTVDIHCIYNCLHPVICAK